MKHSLLLRVAPWLVLIVVAYAAGRWHGPAQTAHFPSPETPAQPEPPATKPAETSATPASAPTAANATTTVAETPANDRAARMVAEVDALAEAARHMASPDSRTLAFFERLESADLDPVATYIEKMPPGNEQDLLFTLLAQRWAEIDGPAGVARAAKFPSLATRISAQFAAFQAWATRDADAAFARALKESQTSARSRALGAVLSGAGTVDPRAAFALFQKAPGEFRTSQAGLNAAGQIMSAAMGTGRRDIAQALIAEQSPGVLRTQMIETVTREWGVHDPNHAFEWLQTVLPEGEERDGVLNGMFTALAHKDPEKAATWGAAFPDERRQMGLIAAAVSEWAPLDSDAAETWLSEQPSTRNLDGASYAIAAYFLSQHEMLRSFAWIRRINQVDARAELFGNLGRIWSVENPVEFKKFIDETSLNPVEVKMLFAKIGPAQ